MAARLTRKTVAVVCGAQGEGRSRQTLPDTAACAPDGDRPQNKCYRNAGGCLKTGVTKFRTGRGPPGPSQRAENTRR